MISLFALIFAASVPVSPENPEGLPRHHFTEQCRNFSHEVQEFSDHLTIDNLKIFCSDLNDAQRAKAMQLADLKDLQGRRVMTPDQAVQKVFKEM